MLVFHDSPKDPNPNLEQRPMNPGHVVLTPFNMPVEFGKKTIFVNIDKFYWKSFLYFLKLWGAIQNFGRSSF